MTGSAEFFTPLMRVSILRIEANLSDRPYILFISFFCGIRGNCPAEWADDKIRVLQKAKKKVIVLTGMGGQVTNDREIIYYQVPSLSWNDFRYELSELGAHPEPIPMKMWFLGPIAFVFGVPFDFMLRKITNGISSGRWSWVITALPVALWIKLRFRIHEVFATGGPTGAQLIGAIASILAGGRFYCEFQDPLVGVAMIRSKKTRVIATFLESWLTKVSNKVIFVTETAAQHARERNGPNAHSIVSIYPGAWQFLEPIVTTDKRVRHQFEFLHLGTLYDSRNLDLFFQALDALRAEGFEAAKLVRVTNLGAIYSDAKEGYLARTDFQLLAALDRVDALKRAQSAACLLLVQHKHQLSQETIPYKTYDYLNLRMPVVGLLNNVELSQLLQSHGGFTAQVDDMDSIKAALKSCLELLSNDGAFVFRPSEKLDISKQFLQVFE